MTSVEIRTTSTPCALICRMPRRGDEQFVKIGHQAIAGGTEIIGVLDADGVYRPTAPDAVAPSPETLKLANTYLKTWTPDSDHVVRAARSEGLTFARLVQEVDTYEALLHDSPDGVAELNPAHGEVFHALTTADVAELQDHREVVVRLLKSLRLPLRLRLMMAGARPNAFDWTSAMRDSAQDTASE